MIDDDFEWHWRKRDENIEKHDADSYDAKKIWLQPNALLVVFDDQDYDEDRFIAMDILPDGKLLVVVHTYREDKIRLISAREANPKERKFYEKAIRNNKR